MSGGEICGAAVLSLQTGHGNPIASPSFSTDPTIMGAPV